MSEQDSEGTREREPNPTQEAIDQKGPSDQPVDVGGWEEASPARTRARAARATTSRSPRTSK